MLKEIVTSLLGLATLQPVLRQPASIRASWGLQAVDVESAWTMTKESKEIVVAVIDTGTDISHPDLEDAIWTNPGETGQVDSAECARKQIRSCDRSRNGIDDDGNGYVDDVHGWNFAHNTNVLTDRHGHGTHIAGIIAATGRYALKGVAPNAKLMILKYTDPRMPDTDPLYNTVHAIQYAVKMGAKIINYSAGGKRPSRLEREAIAEASAKGVLFIAAAGNEGTDSDLKAYYPADYDLPNILSVTAIDPNKRVLPSSNFGARSVQVAAPGERILSTMPDGKYGLMTGTSQATAFATGVAALLLANRSGRLDPAAVAEALASSGEFQMSLREKTKYQTALNARRALMMHDQGTSATGLVVEQTESIDPRLLTPEL